MSLTEAAIAAELQSHWFQVGHGVDLGSYRCRGCGYEYPARPMAHDIDAHRAAVVWAVILENTTIELGFDGPLGMHVPHTANKPVTRRVTAWEAQP